MKPGPLIGRMMEGWPTQERDDDDSIQQIDTSFLTPGLLVETGASLRSSDTVR